MKTILVTILCLLGLLFVPASLERNVTAFNVADISSVTSFTSLLVRVTHHDTQTTETTIINQDRTMSYVCVSVGRSTSDAFRRETEEVRRIVSEFDFDVICASFSELGINLLPKVEISIDSETNITIKSMLDETVYSFAAPLDDYGPARRRIESFVELVRGLQH